MTDTRGLVNITRWPGKPTSGRFVYQTSTDVTDGSGAIVATKRAWYWQCDLHDEEESLPDQYGEPTTWEAAVAGAIAHAAVCPFVAVRP